MKKILSILLAMLLALGALTGCGSAKTTEPASTEAPTEAPAETTAEPAAGESETDETQSADAQAAYAAFTAALQHARTAIDPDTVVATVDGKALPWKMLYYFIVDSLQEVYYYIGQMPEDFSEELLEGTSWQKYFTNSALNQAIYFIESDIRADELGAALSEEQRTAMDEVWDRLVADYGDEELLLADMEEACLDKELFLYLRECLEKQAALMRELYGADGEKLTEEEVLAWAAENGYVRTKHVLWSFLGEDGSVLDDEGKAALREKLEGVLAELQALSGDKEALEARFDELMNSESADSAALETFPAGYTYSSGTMVPAFEEAAFALGDHELSGVVETDYGFHILLGLPLQSEAMTMDQDANTGAHMTLRQSAANALFNEKMVKWIDEAEVVWNEGYEEMDFNTLFHGE